MQKSLDDIFDGYERSNRIIKNRKAITTSYKPNELPFRENEIRTLASILSPSLNGDRPSNIFIFGKPGTGKTAVSYFVSKKLMEKSKNNVNLFYLNCKMRNVADTEYRMIAQLARELGEFVPATGLPTDHVYNLFFRALEKKGGVIILVLDEIDALVEKIGDNFLYNLTRINEDLKKTQVSIVGISNNLSFLNDIDPRVKSSLSEEEILFYPYNATQLQDILKNRSEKAFKEDALSEGVIEKCAALAAQEHGDARRALDLLRVAAEIGERENSEKVKEIHVDLAESKIDSDRIIKIVKSQPRQSQAVLWSIMKKGGDVYTGDIFSVYEEICSTNGLSPLTQRRVSDLIAELDMLGIINAKVISKGRYGRTRVIKMNLHESLLERIRQILRSDYYFQ